MDLLLFAFSFPFSFFFIILSYWKEDRNLNIIGSLSLVTVALILLGSGLQQTEIVKTTLLTVVNTTYNYTTNTTATNVTSRGFWFESFGIGLLVVLFTLIQFLYFILMYDYAVKSPNEEVSR